jgi:hypothetical protein
MFWHIPNSLQRSMVNTELRWGSLSLITFKVLRFYPHFSTFLTHFPMPLTHVHPACASKSQDLFSLTLHSCALSSLPTFSFGSLQLCHSFLSRSSDSFASDSLVPFSTIHLLHLVCFLIPVHVTGTSRFTFIRGPMLLSLILYYT